MKKVLWCAVMLMTFLLFYQLPTLAAGQAENSKSAAVPTDYFPFLLGWQWEYNYISEEQDINGAETVDAYGSKVHITKTKAKLKMEAITILENNSFILAEITGSGFDFGPKSIKSENYFLTLHKTSGYFWQGAKSVRDDFLTAKLSMPREPMLVLPLKVGKNWGVTSEFKRDDHMYEWYVEAEETIKVPAGTFKCFRLVYRTNPDHELIWFCPKIGIVKQEYRHHGTISNTFVELVSYGLKK